jgi:hypothetical protein
MEDASLELATSSTLTMVIIPNNKKDRRRAVRFSNDPRRPDSVVVQVQYIESITDPFELAQVHSTRSERDRYRRETRAAAVEALIDNAALLEDIQQAFFGPYRPGGADRKLRLLIQWNLSDETHRGLEQYIFEETMLMRRRRQLPQQQQQTAAVAGSDGTPVKWAVFLALADCMVVHGMSKLIEDVSLVREHQSSLVSSVSCHRQ